MLASEVKADQPVYKTFNISDVEDVIDKAAPGAMRLKFRISSPTRDRDKDIIPVEGWRFDNYVKNPVIQWAHKYDTLPVARSLKIWTDEGGVWSLAEFTPDELYDKEFSGVRGSTIYNFIKAGFLSATSVGFTPIEWEPLTKDDVEDGPAGGTRFLTKDLLEYSIVPVPSNPEALVTFAFDNAHDKSFIKQLKATAQDIVEYCDGDCPISPVLRPFPSEHACRLRPPGDFQPDSFRRTERDHEGKKYSIIMGRLKGETTMTEQAYRYPRDTWDANAARAHCSSHKGSFEAAKAMEIEAWHSYSTLTGGAEVITMELEEKQGRVFSKKNEADLRKIRDLADGLLRQLSSGEEAPKDYTVAYPLGHEAPRFKEEANETAPPEQEPTAEGEAEGEENDIIYIIDTDELVAVLGEVLEGLEDELQSNGTSQSEEAETP